MNRKFWYLTKMSLKKKVGTKWFAVVNALLAVAIIALINMDTVITSLGGDFDQTTEIIVVDETDKVYEDFENNFNILSTTLEQSDYYEVVSGTTEEIETIKEEITDNYKILVVITEDEVNYLEATIHSENELSMIDTQLLNQVLNTTKYNYAIVESGIDQQLLGTISTPITIENNILSEDLSQSDQIDIIMGTIFPIFILPFFMLTIFIVQMIGAEVNEEKTTKSMEIILSNVSAKTHFFSKILAVNTFVILQGTLLLIYSGLGILFRSMTSTSELTNQAFDIVGNLTSSVNGIENLGPILIVTIIFMLLSFVAYSLIAGILASMTTNMEDYQQIQMPIMVILVISYYLSFLSGLFEGALFIRVLAYVPLISTLLAPSLLVVGQITMIDVIISLIILVLFNYFLIKRGLKIYKIGVLNYSNEKIWTRFLKAAKSKDI